MIEAIDLFAGPGGWDTGIAPLGIRPKGFDFSAPACRTAEAAGHSRVLADIAKLDPRGAWQRYLDLLIASPPCQGFSMAGKGDGRLDSELLLRVIPEITPANVDQVIAWLHQHMHDDKSVLVLEPLRWAMALNPRFIALEQVPAVLPLWEAYAVVLRRAGYHVATGNLQAEQYGVPQTRKRAILVAAPHPVSLPAPTHSRYYSRDPQRLDEGVLPWVSMAQALGWGTDREAVIAEVEPRVNNQSGTEFDLAWPLDRPAPVIAGREIVTMPGANANRFNGATKSRNDGVRVTVQEAGILQSFPADYPWAGTKTEQFQQVGDAVPPLLAYAIVKELTNGA